MSIVSVGPLGLLIAGLVLRFATSANNTWGGVHTQTVGDIALVLSGVAFVLTLLVSLLIAWAWQAGKSRRW